MVEHNKRRRVKGTETPNNPVEVEVNGRSSRIAKKTKRADLKELQLHGLVDILAATVSQSRRPL